jgi:hypothetical protein
VTEWRRADRPTIDGMDFDRYTVVLVPPDVPRQLSMDRRPA